MNIGGVQSFRVRLAEQVEARDELLVENRDLAVEYEDLRPQLGDGGGQLAEAGGVIDSV
jgi:hypothetical protein